MVERREATVSLHMETSMPKGILLLHFDLGI